MAVGRGQLAPSLTWWQPTSTLNVRCYKKLWRVQHALCPGLCAWKLTDHPRVSELNPSGKVFWIKSPRLRWVPLLLRVKDRAFDYDSLLEMQWALQNYIGLLYSKGVAYQVKPEYMCPVRMESGSWKLYLGCWMEAEFDPSQTRVQSAEWKTREGTQDEGIKRNFAEARAAVTGRYHWYRRSNFIQWQGGHKLHWIQFSMKLACRIYIRNSASTGWK